MNKGLGHYFDPREFPDSFDELKASLLALSIPLAIVQDIFNSSASCAEGRSFDATEFRLNMVRAWINAVLQTYERDGDFFLNYLFMPMSFTDILVWRNFSTIIAGHAGSHRNAVEACMAISFTNEIARGPFKISKNLMVTSLSNGYKVTSFDK